MIVLDLSKQQALDADLKAIQQIYFTRNLYQNQELAQELHKPIIRKFEKRKVFSSFRVNIWGTDLAGVQLISNLINELVFYYMFLIFMVNIHELFL